LFMLIFKGSSGEEFKAKVAIVEEQPNETSQMMFEQLKDMPVFEIESGQPVSREEAEAWLLDKDVDAVIVLPESADHSSLLLLVNRENEKGAAATAVSSILDKYVQQANLVAAGAVPAYELQMESISSGDDDLKYEDFLLTGMIALSIAQGGLFGMADMVEMRRKGLMRRLRMTPAKMGLFGLSDMIMRLLFAVVQIILLSMIGVFGFGATLHIDLFSLFIVFFIGALSFNALGYLISSFSKTMEAYMGVANLSSFLMMFLSGVFFPVETMPSWLQSIAQVLPLTYFVDGLREGMVYATNLVSGEYWLGLGILILWGATAFALGSALYRSKSIASAR